MDIRPHILKAPKHWDAKQGGRNTIPLPLLRQLRFLSPYSSNDFVILWVPSRGTYGPFLKFFLIIDFFWPLPELIFERQCSNSGMFFAQSGSLEWEYLRRALPRAVRSSKWKLVIRDTLKYPEKMFPGKSEQLFCQTHLGPGTEISVPSRSRDREAEVAPISPESIL